MNSLGYRLYFSTYKNAHFVHDCKKKKFKYLQKCQTNVNKNRVFGYDITNVFLRCFTVPCTIETHYKDLQVT